MKRPLTLEVGSGDNPREKSDILVDRYIYSDQQRAGKFHIRINRPIIVGNGYHLPFADKQFDYVICSHVLEHLKDPVSFAKELMRVGKAGYIEVPNIYGERLFGWHFHLWHCEYKNKTLIMSPKKHAERFGGFFHKLIAQQIWFRRFFDEHENKFYIKFEWNGSFLLEVRKREHSLAYLGQIDKEVDNLLQKIEWSWRKDFLYYASWMKKRIIQKIKKEIRQIIWDCKSFIVPKSVISAFTPLLRCIKCYSKLSYFHDKLQCTACKLLYSVEKNIPIMLTKEEKQKGY